MKEKNTPLTQLARLILTTLTFSIILGVNNTSAQWFAQTSPTTSNLEEVHFFDANIGMAVGYNVLIKTTDGGSTWTSQTPPAILRDVHVVGPQTAIAVGAAPGSNASIHRTTDFGLTWNAITGLSGNVFYAVDFDNNSVGLACGATGLLYRTTDMGVTWSSVNSGTISNIWDVVISGNTAYYATLDGSVGKSTDAGITWTNTLSGSSQGFSSLDFYHPDSGMVGGWTSGSAYFTTENGGNSWANTPFSNHVNAHVRDLQTLDYSNAFIINYDPFVWRSYSPGNWVAEPVNGLTLFDTLLAVHFPTPTDGWAVGQYGVIAHTSNGGGCSPSPSLAQPNVCLGDTVSLLSYSGWTNYIWTDSATNTVLSNQPTQVISPSTDMTIYFEATNPSCGIFRDTLFLNILGCDSVWPGDANSDGITNMTDLLYVGYGAGSGGTTRPAASINWTPQFSLDWLQTFGLVVNYKHADCNGDGTIGFPDTLAVSQNYNLTHNKSNGTNSNSGVPLYLVPMFDSLMVGDSGYFRIMLGDVTTPAQDLHGIAFTFQYDNALIDTNSVAIDFDTTWIAPTNMSAAGMSKDFYYLGRTDAGYTHMNQLTSSSYGQIGGITFVTIDNISGKTENIRKMFNYNITGALAFDSQFDSIAVATSPDSVLIWEVEIGLPQAQTEIETRIFPNPTTGLVQVDAGNQRVLAIRIMDLQGRILRKYDQAGTIDLSSLANGLYMVAVTTEYGQSIHKLNIRR